MKKTVLLLLSLCLCCTVLSAQTEPAIRQNQKGDQATRIGASLSLPVKPDSSKMHLGGSVSLGYDYYLSSNLLIGGEATFMFNSSIGQNVLYCVPLLFNATWQFTSGKFEFPCTLGFGYAIQSFTSNQYFGPELRPQVGAYYRMNSEWSLGINGLVHIIPEFFFATPEYNYVKVFGGLQASARYHF